MRKRWIVSGILLTVMSLVTFSCTSTNSPTQPNTPTPVPINTSTPTFTPTLCVNASNTPCTATDTPTATSTFTPTNTPTSSTTPLPGATWVQATSSAAFNIRYGHSALVYNPSTGSGVDGKMWVIGGINGGTSSRDVWYSTDGASWTAATTQAAFSARAGQASLVYNNQMWVIGGSDTLGFNNDVWSSSDGVTWTQVLANNPSPGLHQFPGRTFHTALVYNNKMWVIGGQLFSSPFLLNDVWSSSDGVSWTQVLADTGSPGPNQFSRREEFTALVYNNQMWVIGGSGNSNYNDAWYSTDGATWSAATTQAAFTGRYGHTSVVFGNQMWVIGGQDNTAYRNDVWYSGDGATWTQATLSANFLNRDLHASMVYNTATGSGLDGSMWVIGGNTQTGNKNDVWHSP